MQKKQRSKLWTFFLPSSIFLILMDATLVFLAVLGSQYGTTFAMAIDYFVLALLVFIAGGLKLPGLPEIRDQWLALVAMTCLIGSIFGAILVSANIIMPWGYLIGRLLGAGNFSFFVAYYLRDLYRSIRLQSSRKEISVKPES